MNKIKRLTNVYCLNMIWKSLYINILTKIDFMNFTTHLCNFDLGAKMKSSEISRNNSTSKWQNIWFVSFPRHYHCILQHVVSVAMTFVNKNGSRNYIVMCPCNLFCCIYDSEYTSYLDTKKRFDEDANLSQMLQW